MRVATALSASVLAGNAGAAAVPVARSDVASVAVDVCEAADVGSGPAHSCVKLVTCEKNVITYPRLRQLAPKAWEGILRPTYLLLFSRQFTRTRQ